MDLLNNREFRVLAPVPPAEAAVASARGKTPALDSGLS
jgi:hypothetical protein